MKYVFNKGSEKYLLDSLDIIDRGIFLVDKEGLITGYNKKITDIFGLDLTSKPGHSSSCVNEGDIVIIADYNIGRDDGLTNANDLNSIGIEEPLVLGQALVAIGVKGAQRAFYKMADRMEGSLEISQVIKGVSIYTGINFQKKKLIIKINKQLFSFNYFVGVGHLVVLDKVTLEVKFYQARGFAVRDENIKSIVDGKVYATKGINAKKPQLLNKHISTIFPDSEVIKRLVDVAKGGKEEVNIIETTIYDIYIRCSIHRITEQGHTEGALLIIQDITELEELIEQRDEALASLEHLEQRLKNREIQSEAFKDIIGVSDKIKETIALACRASESSSNVLLLGESGTGKNLFAEAIHKASLRKEGPYVYINCASIPENLLESELFGYEKGAFTGALSTGKLGRFEVADKGTIFLDEIAELPVSLQAKLLNFLQTRNFTRVGGLKPINVDVRIIAATNKNLEELVSKEKFRTDFYYRLNVISINIPPLRERMNDIPHLIRFLLPKICNRIEKTPVRISAEAEEMLRCYNWKGNIRELENILERAINICNSDIIEEYDLPKKICAYKEDVLSSNTLVKVTSLGSMKEALEQTERQMLIEALKQTQGSRDKAISLLDMGRTNFYLKLKKHNLNNTNIEKDKN